MKKLIMIVLFLIMSLAVYKIAIKAENAKRDANHIPVMIGVDDGNNIRMVKVTNDGKVKAILQ